MTNSIAFSALAAAACMIAAPGSAQAVPVFDAMRSTTDANGVESGWQHGRHRGWRSNHRHGSSRTYYEEPVHNDTRVWRGRDGRTYCRKKDGTTGLIIGGAVGALLGREIDGGRERTLGTILGAAGGAVLGRSIARDGARCR